MASGSKFLSSLRIWLLIIPFVMVFVIPFFNLDWVSVLTLAEINSNKSVFGYQTHEKIHKKTDDQFTSLFIETKLYGSSIDQKGTNDFKIAEASNTLITNYYKRMWKMVYRAMYRFNVAMQWLGGGIILIFAFTFDGWQMRNIKKHSVRIGNPLAIHFVLHSFFLLVGAGVAMLFFPIPMMPLAWAIGILLLSLFCWKLAESFQSGSNA